MPTISENQIKYMVSRFLQWRLPENFSPDAGISLERTFNENSPFGPMEHKPIGTNLFDAVQAEAMVRHMADGVPVGGVSLNPLAMQALKTHQRQLDADGVEVGVSRQALDELIAAYEAGGGANDLLKDAETAIEEYSCRTQVSHIATEMEGLASRIRAFLSGKSTQISDTKKYLDALESIDAVGVDFGHFESAARTMQEIARKAVQS
jgi:hypothetical protein